MFSFVLKIVNQHRNQALPHLDIRLQLTPCILRETHFAKPMYQMKAQESGLQKITISYMPYLSLEYFFTSSFFDTPCGSKVVIESCHKLNWLMLVHKGSESRGTLIFVEDFLNRFAHLLGNIRILIYQFAIAALPSAALRSQISDKTLYWQRKF